MATSVSSYTVLFDACVLYPAPLRDFLIEVAASGLFRARWTAEIHDEWIRNVLKNRPDLKADQLWRTRELMDRAVMDSLVTGYEPLISGLDLPDPDDRHVLAAAIKAGADALITFNRKDFPASVVEPFDIEVQHPDDFLLNQFGLNDAKVITAARTCRARLKAPAYPVDDYLETLERQSLPQTVAELRRYASIL